jgi:Spy/CpxP family protein refolding chaperone
MKTLKNLIIIALFGLVSMTFSFAQPGRPNMQKQDPEARARAMTDRMTDRFGLTEAQAADLYEVNLQTAKEMETMKKRSGDEMKALNEARDAKIASLLTDEQRVKFEEQKERREAHMEMSKTPEGRAQLRTDRMADLLELSESQATEIYRIHLDQATQMESLKKDAGEDRSGMREQMREIQKNTRTRIDDVLTDEQKAILQAKKEEKSDRGHQDGMRHGDRKGKKF